MLKRNLWKIIVTLGLLGWALSAIIPLNDTPFVDFARATASPKEITVGSDKVTFAKLLDEAAARKKNLQAVSEFVGLKQIGKERRIDLSQFFPDIRLEASLKNIEKRNDLVLNEVLRLSKRRLPLGLDLAGGVAATLEAGDKPGSTIDDAEQKEKIQKAIEVISRRVNGLGVAEPVIRPVGKNRIEVQLAGINTKDNPDLIKVIQAPARLDFRTVHPTLSPGPGVETPIGYEILVEEREGRGGEITTDEVFVKIVPEMSGDSMDRAGTRYDLYGKPEIYLNFTKEGGQRFADVTRRLTDEGRRSGRPGRLAIVLDGKLYSSPTVREEISGGSAQITGTFSEREALNIANVLNNPLNVELKVVQLYEVGPTLAEGAIKSGTRATYIGVGLVAAFMVAYYTVAGFIAVLSVSLNILIVLGVLASLGATLTMPGIAGIVLTVGMAVDAHILIFERMREELRMGKSLVTAFHAGHEKAFTTIIDANLTTLITSGLMVLFGTGAVKGFGITITIGIFSTMFTALIVSELLLDLVIVSGVIKRMMSMNLPAPRIDFVKYGRPVFIASWILILVGLGTVVYKGHRIYGIDFAGGDSVTLAFKEKVDIAKIQAASDAAKLGEIIPSYQQELGSGNETLTVQTEDGKGAAAVAALQKAFPQAGLDVLGKNTIGPAVGKEIQWNALMSIALSLVGILIYVAIRFEVGYGMGAVVSTVHDVLMTIGIFVLFDRQFTAPMVGAILLIVGYSINDTIVVFDRIREELKLNPGMSLRDVINMATNRVFTRSLLTSFTTLLAAVALFIFGGGIVDDLAFTFIVGILTGAFSSIFIASPIFYWWHKGDRKHVEAHHDVAPKYEWQGTSKAAE
ncbi:MAG: protein translocase subunit SecD [Opitutaceae bacterium]|nr:protein translocase subunit SecD [Opitutaceae bacterium]